MKAVLLQVSDADLDRRRKLGLHRWDEMWEGVLHMPPAPFFRHQRLNYKIGTFLEKVIEGNGRGTLAPDVNVFNDASGVEDYRIPDFSFVARGREAIIGEDGIHGGPDAVIEIRSPGDETYEKLPFFARLGVSEMVVVDRDTSRPDVFRLAGSQYLAVAADAEGWVVAEVLGVRLRAVACDPPRLAVQSLADREARVEI